MTQQHLQSISADTPPNPPSSKAQDKIVWSYFLKRLWVEKSFLLTSVVFAVGSAASTVLIAQLVRKFGDETLFQRLWSESAIQALSLGLIALIFFQSLCDFCHKFLLRKSLERMAQKLRADIFSRYLSFSEAMKTRLDSGTAIHHVVSDVQLINESRHFITEMIKEPLTLVGLIGYLFYLNFTLCMICVVALLPIAIANKMLGKSARRNQSRVQSRISELISSTNENFQGLRTVHTFLLEKKVLEDFKKLMNNLTDTILRITKVEEGVSPVIKVISSIIGAVLLYVGAYYVSKEKSLTPGELMSFVVAAGLLQSPLRNMSHAGVQLQRISAGAKRIWDLFQIPFDALSIDQEKLLENDKLVQVPQSPLALELKNVSFEYPHSNKTALKNVSLRLDIGKKIALVGKSGSGKTTLSLLALRLIDPSSGNITLGNKEAKDWDLLDYRSYFSYVSQEVFFFQGSIRENLLKVAPSATEAELWNAIELAQMRERVSALPQQLDTHLSEKAANLSGGERQRLAIARALLRKSPILILDEATSNLDSENERLIQKGLDVLLLKSSSIIIAHRLSTVLNCDQVLVFENGEIVESGHPQELRSSMQSKFSQMWNLQQGTHTPVT